MTITLLTLEPGRRYMHILSSMIYENLREGKKAAYYTNNKHREFVRRELLKHKPLLHRESISYIDSFSGFGSDLKKDSRSMIENSDGILIIDSLSHLFDLHGKKVMTHMEQWKNEGKGTIICLFIKWPYEKKHIDNFLKLCDKVQSI